MAKISLGCEPVVGSLTPSKKREYRVTNRLQEGKRPIYAVVFNFIDSRYFNVFATAGGNRVTVYQCLEGGVIAVLQSYIDEDKDESFYTVSWACNIDGTPLLVAGGLNGVIRVIDAGSEKIYKSFVGHGDSINEIKTQPLKPSLVVSASKDESVRLWNVHTGICILIFAGAGGHRNEVLSVDFHPSDMHRIASCGMDNTVKIWSMKGMSFDPSAVRRFVNAKAKAPQPQPKAPSKGKKRPRVSRREEQPRGPGETSQARRPEPSPRPDRSQFSRELPPRRTPEVVDLEDDSIPPVASVIEDYERCHLVPSIVAKYRGDVGFDEGMKALELLTLKTLSVARGLSLQGMDESHKMAGLVEAVELRDKKLADMRTERDVLLKEREEVRAELQRARDEIGSVKDEAEEAKLELDRVRKEHESKLAEVKARAWEEFKTSEDCDKLKGEYASGAYLHAFKEARAYLRANLPNVQPDDLKAVPGIAETLELSEAEDGTPDGDDAEDDAEDDDVEVDVEASAPDDLD